jgi:hypothetical protein
MAPLELRVPHSLSREEIHCRIDAGLARARSEYEGQVGPIEAEWVDPDRMTVGCGSTARSRRSTKKCW